MPGPASADRLLLRCLRLAREGRAGEAEALLAAAPATAALRAEYAALAALPEPEPGTAAPRGYSLLRRLGQGGMGVVDLAEDLALERLVALKRIRPELLLAPTARARFLREARALAGVAHPNVVRVHAVAEIAGQPTLVLEYVPGEALATRLERLTARGAALRPAEVLRVGIALADALAAAHAAGVLHRDVKPGNVRLAPDGRVLLLDFGLARILDDAALTRAGHFQGSLLYCAPEQARGDLDRVGPAADVYALGATLYECLAGRPPFAAPTSAELLWQIERLDPTPLRRLVPGIPGDLATVVEHALGKAPERRYADGRAFAEDLRAVAEHRPIRARPPGPLRRVLARLRRHRAASTAVTVVLLAAAGLLAVQAELAAAARAEQERLAEADLGAARDELECYSRDASAAERLAPELRELEARAREAWQPARVHEWRTALAARVRALQARAASAFEAALQRIHAARLRGAPDLVVESELLRAWWIHAQAGGSVRGDHVSGPRVPASFAGPLRLLARVSLVAPDWITVQVVVEPAHARVHALVWREEPPTSDEDAPSGLIAERGKVATPRAGFVLVPAAGLPSSSPLEAMDRIVAVDGVAVDGLDASAVARLARRVRAEGGVLEVLRAGEGLQLRARSGVPVLPAARACVPDSRDALPPDLTLRVPRGTWLLATAEGHEPLLWPAGGGGAEPLVLRLNPQGGAPEGCVRLPVGGGQPETWIQQREVTCGEYLAFLADPQTRARSDAESRLHLVPRTLRGDAEQPLWARGADGSRRLPPEFPADAPVSGVSWHDAREYARWRSRVAELRGEPWVFALPSAAEWRAAAGAADGRTYVCGERFRPNWLGSWYAEPDPPTGVEPGGVRPWDRSVLGVHDLGGGVREWVEDAARVGEEQRLQLGGAWALKHAFEFALQRGAAAPAASTSVYVGFRLVVRRRA